MLVGKGGIFGTVSKETSFEWREETTSDDYGFFMPKPERSAGGFCN